MARPARVLAYLVGLLSVVALAEAVAEGAGEGAGEGVPPYNAGDVPIVGDWVGGVVDGHTGQDKAPFVNDDGSVEAPKIISQSTQEVKVQGVGGMVKAQDSDGQPDPPPFDKTKVPIVGKMVTGILKKNGGDSDTDKTIPFFSNGIPFVDGDGNADFGDYQDDAQAVTEQPVTVESSGVVLVGRAWEALFAVGALTTVALVLRKLGQRHGQEANPERDGLVVSNSNSGEYGASATAPAVSTAV